MNRKLLLSIVLAVAIAPAASGKDWTGTLFETNHHDFGTVAQGARTEYEFRFKNRGTSDLIIAGVSSSCGCTTPTARSNIVKAGQEGAILAHINTDRYTGNRGATITVTFGRPIGGRAQLTVACNILADVRLLPDSVNFGKVERGTTATREIEARVKTASGISVTGIKSTMPSLSGKITEVVRSAGETAMRIRVELGGETPEGYFRGQLLLTTSHGKQMISVPVGAQVVSELAISPALLEMGAVSAGETATKYLVLTGKQPFRISRIDSGDARILVRIPQDPSPKSTYVVPVQFLAGDAAGEVRGMVHIQTSLGNSARDLPVLATVVQR